MQVQLGKTGPFLIQFLRKNYLALVLLLQSLVWGEKLLPAARQTRQEWDSIFPSTPHCGPPRTLSWTPQSIRRPWKLLKTHQLPAPPVSPAGCARSIISARLVAAAAV